MNKLKHDHLVCLIQIFSVDNIIFASQLTLAMHIFEKMIILRHAQTGLMMIESDCYEWECSELDIFFEVIL